jgi:hypothetical protein
MNQIEQTIIIPRIRAHHKTSLTTPQHDAHQQRGFLGSHTIAGDAISAMAHDGQCCRDRIEQGTLQPRDPSRPASHLTGKSGPQVFDKVSDTAISCMDARNIYLPNNSSMSGRSSQLVEKGPGKIIG